MNCNLKPKKLFDYARIGVCAVIRSNTVDSSVPSACISGDEQ